jgi:DNA repair protein RecO (recombination protein O)
VQLYRDDGVVLRTQQLGEADRIITVLGRTTGRIRAVAKGVRRTKSRFGARLEPFTHVDLMLHPGRSLDVITQAEVIRPYGALLTGDYPRYTVGVAMLETAERFTPVEKEPALRQLLLLIGGLRSLGEDEHDPRLVLDAFMLRSLAVAGYAPALQECARCGASASRPAAPDPQPSASASRPASPDPQPSASRPVAPDPQPPPGFRLSAFAIPAGGMVCASCRPPGAASPAAPTVALLLALLQGDWESADRSERRHRVECSGLVAAYLQWHLEHSIRSLRHVERVLDEAAAAPRRRPPARPAPQRGQAARHTFCAGAKARGAGDGRRRALGRQARAAQDRRS